MRNLNFVRPDFSRLLPVKTTSFLWALGLSLSLLATSAHAVSYTWTNAAGGSWTTSGNWNIAGFPSSASDTATLGDISGAYVATLGSVTTIGGLNMSGTNPTVTLNSTLTVSGPVNVNGGQLNGTGTMVWTHGNTINWTAGTPGGSLTFLVPHENTVVVNNTPGTFALASGQKLWMEATGGLGGFPGDLTDRSTTFSNGFSNSGIIQLGSPSPGDNYGVVRMIVTNGTMTNNAGGNINFLPRSSTNSGPPWNTREVRSNIQNNGTITSYAADGILGGTGMTVVNSATGVMKTDHSLYAINNIPQLTIEGTSFSNDGAIQVGANAIGSQGGTLVVNSSTINLNSGSSITGPGSVFLQGNTVNINGGSSLNNLALVGLGRNNITTAVNWNIPDLATATTFRVAPGATVNFNRTGAWNLPSNQVLEFYAPSNPANVATQFNMTEDFNNSGVVRMGIPQPGDNYVQANLNLSGSKVFTNNVGGVVEMWPRTPTSGNDPTWNIRNINANVVNNGTINNYAANAQLGTTGKTVVNNGTININSSFFTGGGRAMLAFAGNSGTNAAGGTIALTSGQLWINTPTFNYDGGSITATGSNNEIILGSGPINTTFNFNGGAEITNPVTWVMRPAAQATINRSSTFNILSGGGIRMEGGGDSSSQTGLTINQDISNSGVIQLGGSNPAADTFLDQRLVFTNANSQLTNNANGTILMYPRSNSSTDDTTWSQRRIEGELINNGQFTIYTRLGNIGKAVAGIDHVNNGTITFDRSYYASGPLNSNPAVYTPTLFVTGSSLLNGPAGVINGNGTLNVTGLPGSVFTNTGTLSPGLSAGILTIQGNVNNQLGSKLMIEITGSGDVVGVDYDQLIVNGAFNNLALTDLVVNVGSLNFDLTGDVFTILTASNNFTGLHFHSVTFTGPGNFQGELIYGNGFIQLANISTYVPEPSTGLLLLVGLVALRKRNRRKVAC